MHRVTVYPKDGMPIKLDNQIKKLDELGARIKAKIYPRLLIELRSELKTGENLSFGPITLNLQTITIRGNEIPWGQVTRINPRAGFLVVELKNQRGKKIPVEQIPNIELFIQLIQEGVEV